MSAWRIQIIRDFALKDPNGFLAEYNDQVIFDEVQQAPAIFSYLQTLVDSRPDRMGGSSFWIRKTFT